VWATQIYADILIAMLLIITVKIGKLDGANLAQAGLWTLHLMILNMQRSLVCVGNKNIFRTN
jgi:hypothetical protein